MDSSKEGGIGWKSDSSSDLWRNDPRKREENAVSSQIIISHLDLRAALRQLAE